MKERTGGGPVVEPPMLKSDGCYRNGNTSDKSIEVRKRECSEKECCTFDVDGGLLL